MGKLCPVCNSKTRNRIREDTEVINFPLYCHKCKNEIRILEEPDAKTQSR